MQHRNMPVAGVASFAFLVILLTFFSITSSPSVRAADKPAATKPGASPEFSDEYFSHPSTDNDQKAMNKLVGRKMPFLKVKDWTNGQVTNEAMKGKVLLIDFWATWCGPCIEAIPHNNELHEKYKDKGLIVIGICSSTQGQEKFKEKVESEKIAYPVCTDPGYKSALAYKIVFYPTYIAVDRKGNVRAIGLRQDKVEEVLEKLLAEKPEK